MLKAGIRKKYKALRLNLQEDRIEGLSMAIANRLLRLPVWDKTWYHLFLSIQKQREIDTRFVLTLLQGKEKKIVVSKSDFTTRRLSHYLLTDTTLIKENPYGIPEPVNGEPVPVSKIEVVFVPLLAFDKKGHRTGYGKGFYDTFLAECTPGTVKIGLSFFEAEAQIDDVYENDISLDYCVTPDTIYDFSS